MKRRSGFLLIAVLGLATVVAGFADGTNAGARNWPQWRGPDGNGMARSDAPLRWSNTQNIKWKAEIAGRGHSTPVV